MDTAKTETRMQSTLIFSDAQVRSVLAGWSIQNTLETKYGDEENCEFKLTPIESGFSGALVFRVDLAAAALPGRSYSLKASAASTTSARGATIAQLIAAAAQDCSLLAPSLLPRSSASPFVSSLGYRWELARWIPGQPLAIDASPVAIARGGEAIGMVHQALSEASQKLDFRKNSEPGRTPRCITDRINRLQQLTPKIAEIAERNQSPEQLAAQIASQLSGERSDDARSNFRCRELAESLIVARDMLARRWQEIMPVLLRQLVSYAEARRHRSSSWVIRDIHRGHMLFTGTGSENVQGILDYDALDCDSPAADLARWSGDFAWDRRSDPGDATSQTVSPLMAAVAGYQRICPFPECQVDLATTLMEVNAVGGLANWLVWLTLESRQFKGQAPRIRERIIHLIASVCRIC